MKKCLFLAVVVFCNVFAATTLEQRARHAEKLLGNFQLKEACREYSKILNAIDHKDTTSLELAYWIHRERGYAAFLLGDIATTCVDIEQMKVILERLGYSESVLDEYYHLLDLANQAKYDIDSITRFVPLTIASWLEEHWNKTVMAYDKGKQRFDEIYFRVTNNREYFERVQAEKRARELYYPDLVYSQEEMGRVAININEQGVEFTTQLQRFLRENQWKLAGSSAAVAATIISLNSATCATTAIGVLTLFSQSCDLVDLVKRDYGALWDNYRELQSTRFVFARMEKENQKASYQKCVIKGISPKLSFAPERDTPWYNTYCAYDVNNQRYDIQVSVGKRF